MSELEQWANRFRENQYLYTLQRHGETTGLFEMKERYGDGVPCYNWTSPVFYVWVNDKCMLACMNYREACDIYELRRKESDDYALGRNTSE